MGSVTATKSTRRVLLAPTSLAVFAAGSVTSITRSGTTATVTQTSHGYTTGDWVLIQGATDPRYNGPFQVTVVDSNTYTVTLSADPGASAAGTMTAQKGVAAAIWGDGTTGLAGCSLPTAIEAELAVRFNNGTSAPGVAPTAAVYTSDTGGSGTWLALAGSPVGDTTARSDNVRRVDVSGYPYALVFFYGNTTNAVTVSATGTEIVMAY